MKITIWGCRGSIPSPGPETTFYGGNTSCVSLETPESFIVLDAGSGIRRLGMELAGRSRIDIFLTHLHLDHIQGLGFFAPLYDLDAEIHIWGCASLTESLRSRLTRYLSPPIFPVRIRDFKSRLLIHEIGREGFMLNDLQVVSDYVSHPSPTLGLRFCAENKIFTYIPDHDPVLGLPDSLSDPEWISGFGLAKDADLLIHDAQYTREEYKEHLGWGHCSIEDALKFAELAEVKKLLFFHHDPNRSDEEIHALHKKHINHNASQMEISFAKEGESYIL